MTRQGVGSRRANAHSPPPPWVSIFRIRFNQSLLLQPSYPFPVRSDTESAEDNSPAPADTTSPRNEAGEPEAQDTTDSKEEKKTSKVASRFSNIFAAVKKSVASKGSNTKDKYASPETAEAEAKVPLS